MPQANTGNSSTILLSFKLLVLVCFLYTFNHDKSTSHITLVTKYAESYSSNPLFSPSTSPSKPEKPEGPDETTPSKEPPLISDPPPKNPDQPNEHTPSQEEPKTPFNEGENKPSPTEEQPQTPPHPGGNEPSPTQETPNPGSHPQTPNMPKTPRAYQKSPMEKVNAKDWDGPSAFLEKGGVIETRDIREIFICRLNTNRRCRSKYIADSVDLLWAFCPIYSSNQPGHTLLYRHHTNFVAYMESFGLKTVVLEAIYPGQKFLVTTAGKEPWEFQMVINDTFYYRENFLNVLARKTKGWEYILWIDSHHFFLNTYWWEDTIYKLERNNFVQLFQTLAHIDQHTNKTISEWFDLCGTLYAYKSTKDLTKFVYAWRGMWLGNGMGLRKEIYDQIGIYDECIAGCCDCCFDYASMADNKDWDRLSLFPGYGEQLMPWIEEARKVINNSYDVIKGKMYHIWHEHYFDWGGALRGFEAGHYNLKTELYRDENYTLRIKEGSNLLDAFPKYKAA